jgi:peptidoglycan hydrolase-like protein with peptidoglycan-binding domain
MTADLAARARARHHGRAIAVAAPIAAVGVTTGILVGVLGLRPAPAASVAQAPSSTAAVTRTDIVNTLQVSGSLSYAGSYTIVNQAQGTAYTWLPAAGHIIERGHALYEVDGVPVTLFYGARPAWRALSEGVTPGPDVRQLDRNLIALGYGANLTVSDWYTWQTAYAVERWQQATGLPVTGTVPLGQVAFASGALRVTSITPTLGSTAQSGTTVLGATSSAPVVTALLPVTQEYLVRPGDSVTVTLPDGVTTVPGTVTAVSSVATTNPGGRSNGSGNTPDAVPTTIQLTRPQAAGTLDQAPVTVNIVSGKARNALAVPISALVALADGGYAVQVMTGAGAHPTGHLVPVRTGLFSNTLVQVTGPGLAAGQKVEVPSS